MKIIMAAVLLGAITAPALADQSGCEADIARVLRMVSGDEANESGHQGLSPDLQPVREGGRCILRNPVLRIPNARGFTSFEADEVSWRSTWPEGAGSIAPQALVLDIKRAQIVPQFDELEDFSYQTRLNAELNTSDLHLDYAFDPAEKRFTLTRLDAAQTFGDRLAMSAAIENFDLIRLSAPRRKRIRSWNFG